MAPQRLRVVAAASFLLAIPLLLAHGIVSHSPVPATGLVPLAVSSGFSYYIYRHGRNTRRSGKNESPSSGQEDRERQPLLPNEAPPTVNQHGHDDDDDDEEPDTPFDERHSFLIFVCDIVLATAILTELVFTWLTSSLFNGQLAMLAAYGTVPLIVNFLLHALFAVRALSSGLAIPQLTTWVAWQLVPSDCPGCGHHLRPESTPEIPWLVSARKTGAAALEGIRNLERPKMPKVSTWWTPSGREGGDGDVDDAEDGETGQSTRPVAPAKPQWLRRHAWLGYGAVNQDEEERNADEVGTAQLFVDPQASQHGDDDNDDVLNRVPARSQTPPEVVVVGKKKQRKPQTSGSPMSPADDAGW